MKVILAAIQQTNVQVTGSAIASGGTIASMMGYLPSIAAIVGVIWFCLLITEWVVNKKWQRKDK